jgi:HAE1 family hydrophobic/amphiphilic exporter-1
MDVDQVIQELRPKPAVVPGINVYMQNLPPIRIGGQLTKSQYQYSLQSPDTDALYRYTPAPARSLAVPLAWQSLAGFCFPSS